MRHIPRVFVLMIAAILLSGCSMIRLMRTMMATSEPNERILGQLFAVGGAGRAAFGPDGVARISIVHEPMETILRPAIINMERPGELELTIGNNDPQSHLLIVVQSNGGMQILDLPALKAGRMRVRLGTPGMYLLSDAMGNHMGKGMMGMIIVGGEVPQEAKLDRPPQRRP
jgi:PQQ system protein